MYNELMKKINDREAVVAVVGLGYVGLPLSVEKAKAGYKVIGLDVQADKVELVNKGENYIGDIVDGELTEVVSNKMLTATTDYSLVKDADMIAICVPTPLDEHHQPDITYVTSSTKLIAKYMSKGTLVVLESTTYPGTTEEVIKPLLEANGMVCGKDFFLAFSPERVDPGNKIYNTSNTPKVVGGVTDKCTEVAAAIYSNVLKGEVVKVSSPAVAEMEKILENTYRNINIGLANEMAILCDKMGIDVWEVIDAAKSKPYGFQAFYPGPGLGGHCIPIDPFYLTWKAREYNYHTRLIEVSAEINNYMPEYTVERIMKLLNGSKKPMNGSKVLLCGVAYKQDIDDLRESPALDVIEHLSLNGAKVSYNDPFIPSFSHKGVEYKSVELTKEEMEQHDIVVITTSHSEYDYQLIVDSAQLLFDAKNATKLVKNNREKIVKL